MVNKSDIVKIVLVFFILTTFLIDFSALQFLNYTPIKLLLLVIIVIVSFIDFQVAVIAMIAFFIIIINLNKQDIKKIQSIKSQLPKIDTVSSFNPVPLPHVVTLPQAPVSPPSVEKPLPEKMEANILQPQVISEFPDPYCPGEYHDVTFISEQAMAHNLDERTKPYEEYMKALMLDPSMKNVQTNEI